ncbi:MAG: 3-dehydroquinate synthase [Gammaproteobacteria bacterium]
MLEELDSNNSEDRVIDKPAEFHREVKELKIDLGARSYPIFIGPNLLENSKYFKNYLTGESAMIVTNDVVAPLYLDSLKSGLTGLRLAEIVLPDGEKHKTLSTVNDIFTRLLELRFDRSTTLIALGGGVVGDITGFAAACYQRGVSFIQVPTTLLAQVDSSVGGKTGVNHPLGKNMIGAFHQPMCVVADTETLRTLDNRQLSAGIAEIIKYGLIGDKEFFEWLEDNIENLVRKDEQALMVAIERSCLNKARIVEEDELESGKRALLNLGHTFGHAIEAAMGYGNWLHGEAVAAGMCMAARMSHRHGWLSEAEVSRIESLIRRANLPVDPPKTITPEKFKEMMSVDKKIAKGQLRLVLLKSIGEAVLSSDYEPRLLDETIRLSA